MLLDRQPGAAGGPAKPTSRCRMQLMSQAAAAAVAAVAVVATALAVLLHPTLALAEAGERLLAGAGQPQATGQAVGGRAPGAAWPGPRAGRAACWRDPNGDPRQGGSCEELGAAK